MRAVRMRIQSARAETLRTGLLVFGRGEDPLGVRFDRAHERIRDQDAVMQVERLAVGIAAGRAADFDEFLDFGVPDRQIDGGRATAQRALGDREGEDVHDADEGHDAGGFAVFADFLADRAQIAPIGADAPTLGGEPDIFVPEIDNAFQRVVGLVQEAGDRQAAIRAAIGEHRGCRHEPHFADIVVEALGVGGVVSVIGGDAGEEVLIAFAGEQIAVVQRGAAEIGQERVA